MVDSIPEVALDFMNKTHFEEIEMVKALGNIVSEYQQNNNQEKQLTISLEHWLKHTKAHFSRENLLMMDINFPMYSVHSGEHSSVLEEMENIVNAWKNNHDIALISDYIFTTWPNWFNSHVNSMDMITAQFALIHGYDATSVPDSEK